MEKPPRNNFIVKAASHPEYVIAVLAAFLLVYFGSPSIGLSPDSITYTSVARSLLKGHGPYEFDGEWLVDFPLGYPLFLTLIMFITRQDPFQFGLVLNGLLYGVLVVICLREMKKNGYSPLLRYGYGICLLFGAPLLQVYSMLWSETCFILCVAIFLAAAGRYGEKHHPGAFWIMTAATAFAGVIRYAGITLLGMGLLLLLTDPVAGKKEKARSMLLFGGGGISLLVANLVLNHLHGAGMAGDRLTNQTPFVEHLQRFGAALIRWLPFHSPPAFLSLICATLLAAGSILLLAFWVYRKKNLYSWASLGLMFTAIYSIFILVMAALTAFQPLDSRLLSPLWFPALAAAAGAARSFQTRIWPAAIGMIMMILLCYDGVTKTYADIRHPDQVYADGIRYDFDPYRASATMAFIRTHDSLFQSSDKPLYSNAAELLYSLDTIGSGYLPRLDVPGEIQDFREDSGYLIWLYHVHAYPAEYLERLRRITPLSPLRSFPDGIIFSILPR